MMSQRVRRLKSLPRAFSLPRRARFFTLLFCALAFLGWTQRAFAGTLVITPAAGTLADAIISVKYSLQFTVSGASGAVTWTIYSGSVPAGQSFTSGGLLSGTATTAGTADFTVEVVDATGNDGYASYALPVETVASLQSAVNALSSTSPANVAAQRAVLEWGLSAAAHYATSSTDYQNLINDVSTGLKSTFTIPSVSGTYPYFAPIADLTSPVITAAMASITSQENEAQSDGFEPFYPSVVAATDRIFLSEEMTRAYAYDGTSLYQNATLLTSILTHLDNVMNTIAQYEAGTLGYTLDFTYAADLPYEYLMLKAAMPQAILPSRDALYRTELAELGTYIENNANGGNEGKHLKAAAGSVACPYAAGIPSGGGDVANNWINADVRYFEALAYIGMVNGTDYSAYVNGGLAEMCYALLPDGGTNYTDQQNEAQSYHYYYVTELERYYRMTGENTDVLALVQETQWFTPLSQTSPQAGTPVDRSIGKWVTAPAWHKYWNENTNNQAMDVIFNYSTDSNAKQYAAWQLNQVGFTDTYNDARYYPSGGLPAGTQIPTTYIAYDQNIQGTRGVSGKFTYIGTTRATPLSSRGKATYVGGMELKPYDGDANGQTEYPLSAAVESAGTIVLGQVGAEQLPTGQVANSNLINEAQNEHNASTTASTANGKFGALTTIHNLSGYNEAATSWLETQTWVLLPTRVIGLVQLTNTAEETDAGISGAFRLISCGVNCIDSNDKNDKDTNTNDKPAVWSHSGNAWTYGNMAIDVFYTDYPNQESEITDTNGTSDDYGGAGWLQLEDMNNLTSKTATLNTYAANSIHHYYLAEFRPTSSPSANGTVGQLSLATGLVGFRFQR